MNLIGNINAIPFRRFRGGSGATPPFPSIPGMIARYSALDLTNEQMKENPVWVDKTGNGHDLQMKNFLWDGMSGVGGYTESFLGDKINWESEIYNSRKMSVFGGNRSKVSIIHNQYHFQTYVKISGIDDNEGKVRGVYFYNMESSFTEGTICRTDGIYKIDITELNERGVVGIWVYPAKKNEEVYDYPVTIEILLLYPGALVFDGVDDYGVCENFPILTKEKGYTVVALRQWIEEKNSVTALASNSKNWNQDGAFVFEYNNLENNYPNIEISFGSNASLGREKSSFTYQTSKLYNGKGIEFGEFLGSDKLIVAKANENLSPCSNAAIWELVFLDHDATEEELTKIKDYFVKTYPWLFPDQAWTVTGKTNEDEDRATIANITGNGNDLVLSNFGFAEGSGYNEEGEYAGYLVTDGVDDKVLSSSFLFGNDFTVVGEWEFLQEDSNVLAGFNKNYTYFVLYNYTSGVNVYVKNGRGTFIRNTKTLKAVTSEGLVYIDFNSEQKVEIADKVEADLPLYIAYNRNNYTKMAFKNLAIYPTVLSKDDCIKAYNYLQTLKAK